jgi:hypothetical protein
MPANDHNASRRSEQNRPFRLPAINLLRFISFFPTLLLGMILGGWAKTAAKTPAS